MFQRLKGAIDSSIAEEQARHRALQNSPSRSSSVASSSRIRGASPAVKSRASKPAANSNGEETAKGPDPKDFDPEFVVDEEDAVSRTATLQPSGSERGAGEGEIPKDDPVEANGTSTASTTEGDGKPAQQSSELPTEVRVKLRKLERLESRYQELLRSYRTAHARVSLIEPFEASLREHTPLTSISDPLALIEYLSQIELRSSMSHQELKRVSQERDSLQERLVAAEKKAQDAHDELRKTKATQPTSQSENRKASDPEKLKTQVRDDGEAKGRSSLDSVKTESTTKSPLLSGMSRTTFSIFSPKKQPVEDPQSSEEPEEVFSFDKELPRLEGELDERQRLVEGLQSEVATLKHDLSVAQESTQSMAQSLESATREVNSLRERGERLEAELSSQKASSESEASSLRSQLEAADSKMRRLESDSGKEDAEKIKNNEELLSETRAELERLRESSAQHADAAAKTIKLQQEMKTLEDELETLRAHKEKSEESQARFKSLKQLADKLSGDLTVANTERKTLEAQLRTSSDTVAELRLGSQNTAGRARTEPDNIQGEEGLRDEQPGSSAAQPGQEATSGKKKNKKKKKAAKPPEQTNLTATKQEGALDSTSKSESTDVRSGSLEAEESRLQARNRELEDILAEKEETITKLRAKIKDQDDLREEIESLRDDLVNLGQEHVDVKDKLKQLEAEKFALETSFADAVKESADLRAAQASANGESKQAHGELTAQFEELKFKAADLQTDLTVAQQLASSRFKDLTDLRTILQKAQPELASLREENSSLKALRDELDNKASDLQKVEARHGMMRTEVGDLRRRVSEKDSEIKTLSQKVIQERNSREKAEDTQTKATQRLQRLENEKGQLTKSLEQHVADIGKSKNDIVELQTQLRNIQASLSRAEQQNRGLKEDLELKAAQNTSAESLMSSMRDQATEMAIQKKEAQERCDSLEEEVSDAHRLLSERSREAETMRRLLSEAESRADSRIRDMKDRMDAAIEERDRVEDEASSTGRRRARDMEDLRSKLRDTERDMKRAEEEKEELEGAQKDWKRRREELERRAETSAKEAEEVRKAMSALRDALDESERQARNLERERGSLRRTVEDTQQRLERLQKTNKILADEARAVQAKAKATDSRIATPRSSMESDPSRSKTISPAPRGGSAAALRAEESATPDTTFTEHLKNVFLKFLEQKDKKNQMQLIPVLGMLLHFDRSDEQKWMAAITTRTKLRHLDTWRRDE